MCACQQNHLLSKMLLSIEKLQGCMTFLVSSVLDLRKIKSWFNGDTSLRAHNLFVLKNQRKSPGFYMPNYIHAYKYTFSIRNRWKLTIRQRMLVRFVALHSSQQLWSCQDVAPFYGTCTQHWVRTEPLL